MKISNFESGKASTNGRQAEGRILPENRPKGSVLGKPATGKALSPLEQGMAVAEAALADIPEVREDLVADIKERIRKGEYKVSGEEIAEMMLRRQAADKLR
jgi:negative regulator of flagellin synthesis FlgM